MLRVAGLPGRFVGRRWCGRATVRRGACLPRSPLRGASAMLGFKLQIARSNDRAMPLAGLDNAWGKILARPVVKSVSTTPCGSGSPTGPGPGRKRLFALGAIMAHLHLSIDSSMCQNVGLRRAGSLSRGCFAPTGVGHPDRRSSVAWAQRHPITLPQMMKGIFHKLLSSSDECL